MFEFQRSLAQNATFHRRVLYGFALLLTATICCMAALFVHSSVQRTLEERDAQFVRHRERVEAQAVGLSSRLMSQVETYERNWSPQFRELKLLTHYRTVFEQSGGIAISGDDLTHTPFVFLATSRGDGTSARMDTIFRIARQIGSISLTDALPTGLKISALIYSMDQTLAAIASALEPTVEAAVRQSGASGYIRKQSQPVEAFLAGKSNEQLIAKRPFWSYLDPNDTAHAAAQIIIPIFHGDERAATLTGSISAQDFQASFIGSALPQGFFLFTDDGETLLAGSARSEREAGLLAVVRRNLKSIETVRHRTLFRQGLEYVIAERVKGTDWIATYAFDWLYVAKEIRSQIATAIILIVASLLALWGGAVYIDRRIARPFARKLEAAYQFNRSIIDTAPVGIAVFDVNRRTVLKENVVAQHLLGSQDNRPFYDHAVRSRGDASPLLCAHSAGHTFVELCWEIDGTERHIGVASSTARFRGRDVIVLGLVDATERRASEMMLSKAQSEADRTQREHAMFMAMMSHEIRTPMHGVIGYIELLEAGHLCAEQRERVGMIRRAFDGLHSLTNDFLDAIRIGSNTLVVDPRPIYINTTLEQCAQHFCATIQERRLGLRCYTEPRLDRLLMGDDHRISQILQNLIGNAIKFTHQGSLTLSTSLLREDADAIWVKIEVIDTGIGIPSALQAMVFKPMCQADVSTSRRFGGSGLGLFLCRSMAELMGGRITLRSEPDVGSIFAVELPLKLPDVHLQCLDPAAPLRGLRIALVGGNARWRDTLRRRIEAWGATLDPGASTTRRQPDVTVVLGDDCLPLPRPSRRRCRPNTIVVTPFGPYTPTPTSHGISVSALSNDALLAALLGMAKDTPSSARARATITQPPRLEAHSFELLIAEDDPVSRALIQHQLAALGCTSVRIAENGKQALEMWQERASAAVITDIGMPYLDGHGLLREIRQQMPSAIVIAATAGGDGDSATDYSAFSYVLRKPVRLVDLRNALQAVEVESGAPSQVSRRTATKLEKVVRDAFVDSWPQEHAAIAEAIKSRDVDVARRRLHRLQGALATLELETLRAQCISIQARCSGNDWGAVETEFALLVCGLNQLGLPHER